MKEDHCEFFESQSSHKRESALRMWNLRNLGRRLHHIHLDDIDAREAQSNFRSFGFTTTTTKPFLDIAFRLTVFEIHKP